MVMGFLHEEEPVREVERREGKRECVCEKGKEVGMEGKRECV